MFLPILASIGFTFAIMAFIGGFRMVRRLEHKEEAVMHRFNGYTTIIFYVIVAVVAFTRHFDLIYLLPWFFGFLLHVFKVVLVKKGLAVRYGGYMGGALISTWLVVIFTHLPS